MVPEVDPGQAHREDEEHRGDDDRPAQHGPAGAQQGEVGDTVLSLTADGPLEGGGTYHCVFEAALTDEPSDAGPLAIGPSTVTTGEPAESCSPGAATTVTLLPDGRLRRVDTAGKSVTYEKSA